MGRRFGFLFLLVILAACTTTPSGSQGTSEPSAEPSPVVDRRSVAELQEFEALGVMEPIPDAVLRQHGLGSDCASPSAVRRARTTP